MNSNRGYHTTDTGEDRSLLAFMGTSAVSPLVSGAAKCVLQQTSAGIRVYSPPVLV